MGHKNEPASEALGYTLLLIPAVAILLVWLWVGSMNLLQRPSDSLLLVVVGTVGLTALLIAVESSQLGMGSKLDTRGKAGNGPLAWFVLSCLLWIVAFPWYLHQRKHYGRKSLVVGGLFVALVFSASSYLMGQAIEERASSVRRSLSTFE